MIVNNLDMCIFSRTEASKYKLEKKKLFFFNFIYIKSFLDLFIKEIYHYMSKPNHEMN
jgi:hypothetical protein